MSSKLSLKNKKIFLTGATSGLGRALIFELIKETNIELLLVDISEEKLIKLQRELTGLTSNMISILKIDLSKEEQRNILIHKFIAEQFDGFINNAGVTSFNELNNTEWTTLHNILRVNLESNIHLISRLANYINGIQGFMICTGSAGCFVPMPYQSAYNASKAALFQFVLSLTHELSFKNTYLAIILPAGMISNMSKDSGLLEHFHRLDRVLQMHLPAATVARYAIRKIKKKKKLILPGLSSYLSFYLLRHLPLKPMGIIFEKIYRKDKF